MFRFIETFLASILKFLNNITGSYALAIITLTIIVRLIIMPSTISSMKSSKKMQELQPKMQEIQTKYKNNPEIMNQKLAEFYKENNFNPFSSCLPLLLQMPIFFALFNVFKAPANYGLDVLNEGFFWIKDLAQPDLLSNVISLDFADKLPGILPIISAVLTFFQFRFTMKSTQAMQNQSNKKNDQAMQSVDTMNNIMQFMFPLMLLTSGASVSSAIALYWSITTLFAIIQQIYINKVMK